MIITLDLLIFKIVVITIVALTILLLMLLFKKFLSSYFVNDGYTNDEENSITYSNQDYRYGAYGYSMNYPVSSSPSRTWPLWAGRFGRCWRRRGRGGRWRAKGKRKRMWMG